MAEREIIMDSMPLVNGDGSVRGPQCCGERMADDGGCSDGCCDDYRCCKCGKTVRIEWPD